MGGNVGREVASVGVFFGPLGTFDMRLDNGADVRRINRSCDGIVKNP